MSHFQPIPVKTQPPSPLHIKLCGIKDPQQAQAIATMGFLTLGFICVPQSPRYLPAADIQAILQRLTATVPLWSSQGMAIGVFADATLPEITTVVRQGGLTGIQLHADESPDFCRQLKQQFPDALLIKAFRLRSATDLVQTEAYWDAVDVLLLDAYHPEQWGGTGKTLPWEQLNTFKPSVPWWLAGGLNPDNIATALHHLHPDGIDLSSGVERSPGDKDLGLVKRLQQRLMSSDPAE